VNNNRLTGYLAVTTFSRATFAIAPWSFSKPDGQWKSVGVHAIKNGYLAPISATLPNRGSNDKVPRTADELARACRDAHGHSKSRLSHISRRIILPSFAFYPVPHASTREAP
jgi:hypothetical protein